MGKHRDTSSGSGKGMMLLAALAVLALIVWGGSKLFGSDSGNDNTASGAAQSATTDEDKASGADGTKPESEATPAPEGSGHEGICGQAIVWAAPEVEPAVRKAAERLADDCVSYSVSPRGAGVTPASLSGPGAPDVWIPGSRAWADLAAEEGANLTIGDAVAMSPVLLAGETEDIGALRDAGAADESVQDVVKDLATPGGGVPATFQLGDPRTDPATIALLNHAPDAFLTGDLQAGTAKANAALVSLAQGASQSSPVTAVKAGDRLVVPATEKQIADAVPSGLAMQGIQPKGGMGTVVMPYVKVGDPKSTAAVSSLEKELGEPMSQGDLRTLSLRPGDPSAPPPQVAGVPFDVTVSKGDGDAKGAKSITDTWARVAPPSDLLTLIDISGSMSAEGGPDMTRIDLARQAMQDALKTIPPRSSIGLWHFSTLLDGQKGHKQIVPVRPLGDKVGNQTQRDLLIKKTGELGLSALQGDTALHDSIWAAYTHMQRTTSEDAAGGVVLLTDGINDNPGGGMSEKQLIEKLEKARNSDETPVNLVLIGIGPDVDRDALTRIADAAGGNAIVLRDPAKLPQAFVDTVASRSG